MARSKRRQPALTYLRRLAEDDYVHNQLGNAATALRRAYARLSRQRGKAAEDKKLYGHLRESATSIRRAVVAVQRKPQPRNRGRKLIVVAIAGGGAAAVASKSGRARLRAVLPRQSGGQANGGAERSGPPGGATPSAEAQAANTSS